MSQAADPLIEANVRVNHNEPLRGAIRRRLRRNIPESRLNAADSPFSRALEKNFRTRRVMARKPVFAAKVPILGVILQMLSIIATFQSPLDECSPHLTNVVPKCET